MAKVPRQLPKDLASDPHFWVRSLIESTTDLFSILEADGTVRYASPSHKRVLGYTPERLVGRNAFELLHPDDLEATRQRFSAALEQPGDYESGEFRCRCADGSWRVLEAVGQNLLADPAVRGLVLHTRDVTDRRKAQKELKASRGQLELRVQERTTELAQANEKLRAEIAERRYTEQALRASEEKYRDLVERLPDIVIKLNESGTILYVSPALTPLTGYTQEDVLGRPFMDFIHPDDLPALGKAFERTVAGQPEPAEYRILRKEGTHTWIRSTGKAIVEGGRVRGVHGVLTDINGQKAAEERLRTQQEELARVLRIATMGEMTAELAHEINQPLGAIVNFADGLTARLKSGRLDIAEVRGVAEEISMQARRAAVVIGNMRDFLRGEPQSQRCNLNDLVHNVMPLVATDVRRHSITVRLELTRLPDVHANRVQIEQVVLNLLRNALDAMIECDGAGHELRIATHAANGTATLQVSDTGIGLPDGDGRVFDAFFTTKPQGLGMGLSISRSLIEAHGGEIWARRNAGSGATVGFGLPGTTRQK